MDLHQRKRERDRDRKRRLRPSLRCWGSSESQKYPAVKKGNDKMHPFYFNQDFLTAALLAFWAK